MEDVVSMDDDVNSTLLSLAFILMAVADSESDSVVQSLISFAIPLADSADLVAICSSNFDGGSNPDNVNYLTLINSSVAFATRGSSVPKICGNTDITGTNAATGVFSTTP